MRRISELLVDLRKKDDKELKQLLKEKKLELFNLRIKHKTMQLTNPNELRDTKKDIARINSIISEKKMAEVNN